MSGNSKVGSFFSFIFLGRQKYTKTQLYETNGDDCDFDDDNDSVFISSDSTIRSQILSVMSNNTSRGTSHKPSIITPVRMLLVILFFHRFAQFSFSFSLTLLLTTVNKIVEDTYSGDDFINPLKFSISTSIILSYGLGYLLAPFFGYLSDAYVGRCKMIMISLMMFFMALLGYGVVCSILVYLCPQRIFTPNGTNVTINLFTCFPLPNDIKNHDNDFEFVPESKMLHLAGEHGLSVTIVILVALVIVLSSLGFSGVFANMCPLVLDQLEGSPERELKSIFHKYYWVSNLASLTSIIIILEGQYFNHMLAFVIPFIANIISIILLMLYRKRLICQPTIKPYPLSIIIKVVLYSFKVKKPQTSKYSAILVHPTAYLDRAKVANEGKYQNETVEEVKLFFRLIFLFLSYTGIYYIQIQALGLFEAQGDYLFLFSYYTQKIITLTLFSYAMIFFNSLSVAITQPILLFITLKMGPYAPSLLQRMGIGFFFGLLALVAGGAVDIARVLQPCNVKLLSQIPQYMLVGVAESIGFVSVMEFTYAQSPYNMKGLLFGFMQCSRGIGIYILVLMLIISSQINSCGQINVSEYAEYNQCQTMNMTNHCIYYSAGLSSGTPYFWLINLIIASIGFLVFVIVATKYRQRRRDYTEI